MEQSGHEPVTAAPLASSSVNQKAAQKLLEAHGWTRTIGGKHVVKMEKPGACAITRPHHRGGDYSPGLWVMVTMRPLTDFHATVYSERGSYWAEVAELPGCLASGDTEAELQEALIEAIRMCAGGGSRSTSSA